MKVKPFEKRKRLHVERRLTPHCRLEPPGEEESFHDCPEETKHPPMTKYSNVCDKEASTFAQTSTPRSSSICITGNEPVPTAYR